VSDPEGDDGEPWIDRDSIVIAAVLCLLIFIVLVVAMIVSCATSTP